MSVLSQVFGFPRRLAQLALAASAALALGSAQLPALASTLNFNVNVPMFMVNGVMGGRCIERFGGVGAGNDVAAGQCNGSNANQGFAVQRVRSGGREVGYLIRTADMGRRVGTNLCLVARNGRQEGAGVMMLECNPRDPRMIWQGDARLVEEPDSAGGARTRGDYGATLKFDQLCLDLEGGMAKGTPQPIIMWGCHGRANQSWTFVLLDDWNI